jgi:hypothetical protein
MSLRRSEATAAIFNPNVADPAFRGRNQYSIENSKSKWVYPQELLPWPITGARSRQSSTPIVNIQLKIVNLMCLPYQFYIRHSLFDIRYLLKNSFEFLIPLCYSLPL